MSQSALTETANPLAPPGGLRGVVADWSSDQRAYEARPLAFAGRILEGPSSQRGLLSLTADSPATRKQ